jgi:serine/threonine protein kinase
MEIILKKSFDEDFEIIDFSPKSQRRALMLAKSQHGSEVVSVRCINKTEVENLNLVYLKTGLDIWRKLDYSRIPRLRDIYEDKNNLFIIFDGMQGGDMCSILGNKIIFPEKKAAKLIHQVIHIISYLHSHNIIHSNIKAEDFYFEDKNQKNIKLCNFEFIHYSSEKRTELHTKESKAIPPEILEGKPYTFASDIYSVGIMLYKMLSNNFPTENKNSEILFPSKAKPAPKYSSNHLTIQAESPKKPGGWTFSDILGLAHSAQIVDDPPAGGPPSFSATTSAEDLNTTKSSASNFPSPRERSPPQPVTPPKGIIPEKKY